MGKIRIVMATKVARQIVHQTGGTVAIAKMARENIQGHCPADFTFHKLHFKSFSTKTSLEVLKSSHPPTQKRRSFSRCRVSDAFSKVLMDTIGTSVQTKVPTHPPTFSKVSRCFFCTFATFLHLRKRRAFLTGDFAFVEEDEGSASEVPTTPRLPCNCGREDGKWGVEMNLPPNQRFHLLGQQSMSFRCRFQHCNLVP